MEKEELIAYNNPKSPISEVFRTLRTNIQFMTSNKGLKTLLVTSSVPGEGKSWVSANLASAFAQEGKKVIVVDSDMRKGRLHSIFNIDKKPGLSNYLSGITEIEDKDNILNYVRQTKVENLYAMPIGDVPPNPSELLGTERMITLIENLKNIFDLVIFDGTPSLIVTDAVILSTQVDATLIVTAYKTTKLGEVGKIKKAIENVGGKIAGIVINKIPISAKKYENSYYYGNHETDNKEKKKDINKKSSNNEASSTKADKIKKKKSKNEKIVNKEEKNKKHKNDKKKNSNNSNEVKKKTTKKHKTTKKDNIEKQIKEEIEQGMKKIKKTTKENNDDKGE